MVFAFTLPTTSPLSFQTFISSPTHPSLPQSASTARHALRLALKAHKRLPRGARQDAHLPAVSAALNEYIPYLFAISNGLSAESAQVESFETPTYQSGGDAVEVVSHAEVQSAWRATLSANTGGGLHIHAPSGQTNHKLQRLHGGRTAGLGIDFEIAFTLTTLGYVLSRLARAEVLESLYAPKTQSQEQRTAAVQNATRNLLQASSVHSLLATSTVYASVPVISTPEIDPGTQSALASLALSEATLLAVLKDDAYVTACIQSRNPNDRDWMVRAPEIPKVRALLFARLCVRAAEYAEQAAAGLSVVGSGARKLERVNEETVRYAGVLGRVARARACRFFAIDAELAGKTGEAIAWLRAARSALGLRPGVDAHSTEQREISSSSGKSGFSRLKREWTERREEKKIGKDAGTGRGDKGIVDAGDDAGRDEEGRVITMLETKWMKQNDTVSLMYPVCGERKSEHD
ncbi:pH-response regulator protein palC [Penicillium diatomitis]|uniref:pH-response regulator protein palC n=1 Tax=Penicillium diatomitis TaxID=2819901 RepID=A0A9W9WTF4_9EURO|nr:pH-response regulator protein palC [Penicillium diatomitis]KAJ5475160.1 pH-response regulator protein palC [Penicillium diatomitis]